MPPSRQETSPTDFATWTEDELSAFLDRRGEDYDMATDKNALVSGSCGARKRAVHLTR